MDNIFSGTKIDLSSMIDGGTKIADLAHMFHGNTTLTTLVLSMGDIPDDTIFAVADLLMDNAACLSVLKLRQCEIAARGISSLAKALEQNNTLTALNLAGAQITDTGGIKFASALRTNTALTTLDLTWNGFTEHTAVAFFDTLRINKTLSALDLSWNFIAAGMQKLASALRDNASLLVLKLHNDDIKDAGAIELAAALQGNKTLTTLDLAGNEITDTGAAALSDMLRKNVSLTTLNLAGNNFSDTGISALVGALEEGNKTLTELKLYYDHANLIELGLECNTRAIDRIAHVCRRNRFRKMSDDRERFEDD